uniref:Rap guanine nucleotide exchange factor n=1 Tax=Acrobeloides nanus TaxID=290746 RepID=A0A914CBY5_9BILA
MLGSSSDVIFIFGKRNTMNLRRNSDCIVIQPSDMIVIDYPDVQRIPVHHNMAPSHSNDLNHHPQDPQNRMPAFNYAPHPSTLPPGVAHIHRKLHSLNLDSSVEPSSSGIPPKNSALQYPRPPIYRRVPSPAPTHDARPQQQEATTWYVTPSAPSYAQHRAHPSNYTNGPTHLSTAQTSTARVNAEPSNHKFFHPSTQANVSIALIGHNGSTSTQPYYVCHQGPIVLPEPSHKKMPPPPPPQQHPPMYTSVPINQEDPNSTATTTIVNTGSSSQPNSSRISKTRFHFTRKHSDDQGTTTVKVRALSGNQMALNSVTRRLRARSTASSSTTDGDDFSGLPEGAVDSDEEDEESCPSHDSFQELKDNVRECLEKEPAERNGDDISILMDFMQQMTALASLPLSIKRQLCLKMVFAVVADAGTVILQHGEKIDSWSVVVNGAVEWVKPSGERIEYHLGDCFGAEPIPQVQYNEGEMRTMVDDCEFVLVEHSDYCTIMSTINQHIKTEADGVTGEIVSETERRVVGNQVGLILIKAKPEKLVQHLIDDIDTSIDAHYVEDFLLMYRVFIFEPSTIFQRLIDWFNDPNLRDRVARIVLLWLNNHFNDFECSKEMLKLLENFENILELKSMFSQQALLNITCSVKSRPRTVTLTRSNRDQELAFNILGGKETGYGVFISNVEPNTPAEKNGLKRGDEIIEVNNQSFKHVSHTKAIDILKESTHLSMTVKSNLMGFKEMLMQMKKEEDLTDSAIPTNDKGPNGTIGRFQKRNALLSSGRRSTLNILPTGKGGTTVKAWNSSNSNTLAKSSMFEKLFTMLKGANASTEIALATDVTDEARPHTLRTSRSNPDISGHLVNHNQHTGHHSGGHHAPELAIKIYRADQSFRYLTIFPETTAKNVVQLALQEFGMNNEGASIDWALCECTVTKEGVIKQRRLPDDMQNLAERMGLNSRFYLKNNHRSENLIPDELAPEVLKESRISLQNLNAQCLAFQLTLQDFAVFSSIEPTEYVDNLFQLESRYGWPQLQNFENLFNREMWWVVTEVCCERNVYKRAKLIKKFIKVARHCRDYRNFNSMFAIISGLDKPAVRRLAQSWEKVSGKYMKMLSDIQQLIDPSRNMSKYRQHLATVALDPPVVPIYPVLRKDLIFSHEANPTYCDKLVNFEKLRMIARIVRSILRLSSASYDTDLIHQQMDGSENGTITTMRKLGSSTHSSKPMSSQSRKKLYEQTLMNRKVKAYLATMPIIDSEVELDRLSIECEALPQSAPSNGSSQPRRRMPSPSPSSVSSHSNQSDQKPPRFHVPKFGVESPQAVQKMLSLVQNSKVKTVPVSKNSDSPQMSKGTSSIRSNNTTPQVVRRIPSFSNSRNYTTELSIDSTSSTETNNNLHKKRNSVSSVEKS